MPRLLALLLLLALPAAGAELRWQPWSDDVFAQAAREHRFVLLNLHAVWCHWCHVMEKETYADPEVIRLLQAKYLLVEVDADSRPDLANRYEDYGWPATIVFDEKGAELVKRRGFLPPPLMRSLLQAIIDDPTPGPSVEAPHQVEYAAAGALPAALREKLQAAVRAGYDQKLAGWGDTLKYLDWDNVEYCLTRARAGDREAGVMARATLDAQRQLVDPVWGGVYQYSAEGDWKHPHFEKLIQFQAENLRLFSLADLQAPGGDDLQTAARIHDYVRAFLTSPDGAFYVSQDADVIAGEHAGEYFQLDDAGRRKQGLPRVDTHLYTRENGWMIRALCTYYRATGDPAILAEAKRAAEWIEAHRPGFRHDERDANGPFLGDALSLGQAELELYAVTGERAWLAKAQAAADFIQAHFQREAGLLTTAPRPGEPLPPVPQYDENVTAVRFGRLLEAYTGEARYHKMAESAMRYLATPEVLAKHHAFVGGVLLADAELAAEPWHLTIVGPKDDPAAQALFVAAQRVPMMFRRTEWYDPREGRLPGQTVDFPPLKAAAAFICTASSCSAPKSDPATLAQSWTVALP